MKLNLKNANKIVKIISTDIDAFFKMRQLSRYKHGYKEVIKVGFIFQVPEIWEKQEPVFNAMEKDDRFDPYIILAPQYDFVNDVILDEYGEEKQYVLEKYSDDRIIYFSNNIEKKLKEYDLIFYPRPYEHYLPPVLRANNVMLYCKICYIPYAFSCNDRLQHWDFYRYVTYNFVESEEMKTKFNRGRYRLSHNSFQHIVWCGYPVFEQCYNNKYNEITDEMSVVWTPRWSYDKNVGGSHFMEYKDLFIEIAQEYPEVTFVFRPHPLMWDNLKKNKLMSDEEIEGYKKKLDEVGIKLDKNRAFSKTARKASILITDISSILPEFLLTRKPIIYCPCNVRVTKTYQRLVGGTYLAYSENDIRTYLAKLIEGNDDKLELRKKIISQNFEYLTSATNNIMDYLYHSINEVT